MDQQYRICKLKIRKSLIDRGFIFPVSKDLRAELARAHSWTDKAQETRSIEEFEQSIEGWQLLSLAPIEKESSDEEVVALALMTRSYKEE